MQNRFIVKELYDFALKEFREKRPTEILGYRVKKAVLLQRGYGPSLLLSGLKGQVVPYVILADYGEHYRLYYILENGVTINAINIPKPEFGQEQAKFEKATSLLFQIPKPSAPENKLEKIKKQLNEKFQNYVTLIEKQTSCKIKPVPIITIYQAPVETKLVIQRDQNFIKFPLELITHKLFDGFLIREAYRLIFPSFMRKSDHATLLGLTGAYFLLAETLRHEWLQHWASKESFEDIIHNFNEKKFSAYLYFLSYLGRYETTPLMDSQLETLHLTFSKLYGKIESNPEIAAQCYVHLADHQSTFIIKAALFFILGNHSDDSKKVLKELSKFTEAEENQKLRIHCEYLSSLQLGKIYSTKLDIASISLDIHNLFTETLNHVKNQVLEVQRIHPEMSAPNKPFTVKIKIKNSTDLTFQNIELTDQLPQKAHLQLISPNKFYFPQLRPNQTLTCEYELTCSIPQKIWFNSGNFTFEDTYENHYVQVIPSTLLQIR